MGKRYPIDRRDSNIPSTVPLRRRTAASCNFPCRRSTIFPEIHAAHRQGDLVGDERIYDGQLDENNRNAEFHEHSLRCDEAKDRRRVVEGF